MTLVEYLTEGKKLEEGATSGPWIADCGPLCQSIEPGIVGTSDDGLDYIYGPAISEANASFISDARTRLPKYREVITAMQRVIEAQERVRRTDGTAQGHALLDLGAEKDALQALIESL